MPQTPLYLDPNQPTAERVRDLLARMTLAEKLTQMQHTAAAIPRLGIPAYNYWSEALHGVARNGRATVFPQAIGLAATWNPDLIEQVASAIGDEGRAKYHEALRRNGFTGACQGLTFWSPNINIFRDPRWGRGQETYGEDPTLTGTIGTAFVRGLQGDHPRYLKAAACAKHFAVHSGPEKDRHTFDAQISLRDLHTTYLPAFEKLVTEAKVEAVMGAYNRLNGEPSCASQTLLVDLLREQWGFEGHVVSDCGALEDIHQGHKVTAGAAESAALALTRGCDLCCGGTYDHLGEALTRGLISEADLDQALARTYSTRFKLGFFDPPADNPYTAIPLSVINSPEHRQLAYQAAAQSIVLLKNKSGCLPLGDKIQKISVFGPNAASVDILLGNYYGLSDTMTTLLEGIAGRAPEGMTVEYRAGCQLLQPNVNPINYSLFEAQSSEAVIACLGLSPLIEGEEGESILSDEKGDRADIALPAAQIEYLKQLAASGTKIILVLAGGSPIALGEAEELADAILFIWYPGQEGGRALADVMFGDEAPSGKLPVTFPKSVDQLPPFEAYSMAGRTYRYMSQEPLYPFGFGLSYTQFIYRDLKIAKSTLASGEALLLQFTLTNTGGCAAEEVAQIYLSDLAASVAVPRHSLVGFRRVRLEAGEHCTLAFTLLAESMMRMDDLGQRRLEAGPFRVTVGGCSPGTRGTVLGAPEPLSALFTVVDC